MLISDFDLCRDPSMVETRRVTPLPRKHPGPRAWGARRGWAVACARGSVGGPPAAARRRPTAVFVRGATETAPDGFGIPGNTMGLATGTSAGLRAGHDVCRAPGSASRWGRAGRKLADARGHCGLLQGR